MINRKNELIAAIITPAGVGGIAVIRLSGKGAINFVSKFFSEKNILNASSHTIHRGFLIDPSNLVLDEVLLSIFISPNSFTGEDVVEISCHGGLFIAKKILSVLVEAGANLAQPGEFTFRAFANGKIDLSQAEAIADLIHSNSEFARRASLEQLRGSLSKQINSIRKNILDLCSLVELGLDFSEEGIDILTNENIFKIINSCLNEISILIKSFEGGRFFLGGIKTVLLGRPNVGKSSFMNVLLKYDRAIVSEIPGTTRDTISESIHVGGLLFRFIDTAGLRFSTDDPIEKEGINRTISEISTADLLIFMVDAISDSILNDFLYLKNMISENMENKKLVLVINKSDLSPQNIKDSDFFQKFDLISLISCKTGFGVSEFLTSIESIFIPKSINENNYTTIQNIRHKDILVKTHNSLMLAKESLINGAGGDLIAVDLRGALDSVGEIVGIATPEDVLNNIFSKFCIGK